MANVLYGEKIKSTKTSQLFMLLAMIFFALFGWRYSVVGIRFIPGLYAFLGLVFCFYVINYRELEISITDQNLQLKFGVFAWRSDIENIKSIIRYDPPFWIKYGGAGVHFALVDGDYKAFYNFLEYPRIMVGFHQKQGWVQSLVFTTRQPEKILQIMEDRSHRA